MCSCTDPPTSPRLSGTWPALLRSHSSVPNPDPHVFGPPGSFYQQAKIVGKTLISAVNEENSQRHGSANPDRDPLQNVMDPEHCLPAVFRNNYSLPWVKGRRDGGTLFSFRGFSFTILSVQSEFKKIPYHNSDSN
jgi:hypothetical protein